MGLTRMEYLLRLKSFPGNTKGVRLAPTVLWLYIRTFTSELTSEPMLRIWKNSIFWSIIQTIKTGYSGHLLSAVIIHVNIQLPKPHIGVFFTQPDLYSIWVYMAQIYVKESTVIYIGIKVRCFLFLFLNATSAYSTVLQYDKIYNNLEQDSTC